MAEIEFKDHFSNHSTDYRRFRPDYPASLYSFLSGITPANQSAWDCATGSGQSARGLSEHFVHVFATDGSKGQIEKASPIHNINFFVATAENSQLSSSTIDLITVAQALHWFEFEAFYQEVNRVLKDNGIIAIWTYNLLKVSPEVDELIEHFYNHIIYDFWPDERRHVESEYRNIPFPFEPVATPEFVMQKNWSLDHLLGYLGTWSAVQKYKDRRGLDPVKLISEQLVSIWGDKRNRKTIKWRLVLMVGKKLN